MHTTMNLLSRLPVREHARIASAPHALRFAARIAILAAIPYLAAGCIPALIVGGAAIAAGAAVYANGDLTSTARVSLDEGWNATLGAVRDLELRTSEQKKDGVQGTLVAKGANDTPYKICLENKGPDRTEFSIRVGVIGDKEKSEIVLAKIRSRLPHGWDK
ncbi:MAG: DUF3568 domain-containing protein [Planctomycetes bacterium]|nr:DUF3568 domain-containing protein [Planctomycetota bacterium]